MGGIWFRRIELITFTSEIVGYKSGLALNRSDLTKFIPERYCDIWNGDDNFYVRLRSEEYEEIFLSVLYGIGNISTPKYSPFGFNLYKKYQNEPDKLMIVEELIQRLPEMQIIKDSKGKESLDPTFFLTDLFGKYGRVVFDIAEDVFDDLNEHLHRSPWGEQRRFEWKDKANLEDLFQSESLETFYGEFIDQRFIDYLSQNFGEIERINWRKFEALTCEFFSREGLYVEIGKGRDDGGIDARIWPKTDKRTLPPTIIVQCKREKKKVGKVVVKALWADIIDENAKSGFIVTTSALSPGAKKVCSARSYPIVEANRETLRKWINTMRSPYTGIFLGE